MRCLVLGALVLVASTACGGPSEPAELRSSRTDLRKEWLSRSSADQAAIRKYSAAFSEDAVDTCVRAYDDDFAAEPDSRDPVVKPHRNDLAAYLCECIGVRTCL